MKSESTHPDSIHESVRRLMRWRYLVVAGVSVAAWVAIGSTSAMAADQAQVHQSNSNTSTTVVDNNDGQSTGLLSGPIVVPVTLGVQTNASGPVDANVLSNQTGSGNGGGDVSQSNTNASTTMVANGGGQSAGLVSGPVVAPITLGVQTDVNGPVNVNAIADQAGSGNAGTGDPSQTNTNWSATMVDNSGAESAGLVSGPVVAPVTLGVQTNLNGPVNADVLSNQAASGNGTDGDLTQVNLNRSITMLDNQGAESAGLVSGPIVVPISPQIGTNVDGPIDAGVLSNQVGSGNAGSGAPPGMADPLQVNVNDSTTMVDNRDAQSAAGLVAISGPIVAPVSPQVGTNLAGPVDVNAIGNQAGSGNASAGDLQQGNFNSSFAALDNSGAQSAAAGLVGVAGPVVVPISPQVGTNVTGPIDANALSNQRDSGNGFGGDPDQVNANGSFTWLDNQNAQSDAVGLIGGVAAAGPIVVPVSPQVGTNVDGPVDANAASNQAGSGNGSAGDVRQGNFNGSFTWLNDEYAQSAAAGIGVVGVGVAGPVVVPVSPQVGTNADGPVDANVLGNQSDSGNAGTGDPEQVNANGAFTFVDNAYGQSDAFGAGLVGLGASGPIVVPVSPQVGTNVDGPVNVNAIGNQRDSGDTSAAGVLQGNFNGGFTWVDNEEAQSDSAALGVVSAGVSGPVVVPVSPQVGTNVNGPVNVDALSNQLDSGNGGMGDPMQLNWNGSWTWVDDMGGQSDSAAVGAIAAGVSGPVVVPVSPQVGTNVDGPVNVDVLGNQLDSGNAAAGPVGQLNWNGSWTWVDSEMAQSDSAALGVVAAGVSGPVVVPVSPQVGTDVNGPVNVNALSDQIDSGNGAMGDPMQLNWNGSWTWVDDMGGQSDSAAVGAVAAGVSGPVVVPVSPQVGTNVDGPIDVNAISSQRDSGNGGFGDVWQANANNSLTFVNTMNAESAANGFGVVALSAAGPVVAPVSPQVGTDVDGPVNVDAFSGQMGSGNGSFGDPRQLNWNSSWTWLANDGASSEAGALVIAGAVAGPVVAPISPQIGTNLDGPIDVNVFANQLDSGNGNIGDLMQDNANRAFAGLSNSGGVSDGIAPVGVAGPVVAPFADDVATNATGPASVNAGGGQQNSGNPGPGAMDMTPAGVVRNLAGPGGLAGLVVAAVAGLMALGSLLVTRRRGVR